MNKKLFLGSMLLGVALVAALAGCAQQALSSTGSAIDWNGITSVQATPKDKVKFKLTEESECDACHDSEVASAQNEASALPASRTTRTLAASIAIRRIRLWRGPTASFRLTARRPTV